MKIKEKYDVLKEIRKIRKKHYEETKHMSMAERMEYDRQKNKKFKEEFSKMDFSDEKYKFPYIHHKKENSID
ncbi:MAG: hypothetical protein LBK82_05910 [Planctomycetaceae bacterium]|jgi:hypothetical protein|nr:hypothetical protein [Planctomycetaceae bacterium]